MGLEISFGFSDTAISIFIGLSGIALAVYFGLRGFRLEIMPKLSKIEDHTKHIKAIEETTIRMDERINTFIKALPYTKGTAKGTLKNVGKFRIVAEPGKHGVRYYIEVQEPILKEEYMEKKSVETSLSERERELFGGKIPRHSVITPHRMTLFVPSNDPKICSEYISYFLKWLDSEYWESLKEVEEYEKISL